MIIFTVACDSCGAEITRSTRRRAEAIKYAKVSGFVAADGNHYCLKCAEKEGYLEKCTGEAHSNPWIDHCGVCAPRWGLVETEKAKQEQERRTMDTVKNVTIKNIHTGDKYQVILFSTEEKGGATFYKVQWFGVMDIISSHQGWTIEA